MFYLPPQHFYTPQATKPTQTKKDPIVLSEASVKGVKPYKQGGTQRFFNSSPKYSQIEQAPEHQDEAPKSKSRCLIQ